jgi:hypothetical protein
MPRRSAPSAMSPRDAEGYGTKLKMIFAVSMASQVNFSGRGEMIPNEQSFCERSTPYRSISGEFPCSAFTGNGRERNPDG